MGTTDNTPKRGRRFRYQPGACGLIGTTTHRDSTGVDHITDQYIVTAVNGGRVYYRAYFPELETGTIGRSTSYADVEPSPRFPAHRPGFAALVAEWIN
jgi:hypothetical protein